MNILIFSWRGIGHPKAGGAEISTYENAKRWVKAGHKVTLFTSSYKGANNEVIDGINLIRKGHYALGVHLSAIKWYLTERKQEYNVVIDQFHGIPFFTPLYVRNKKIGFIHEVTKELWKMNQLRWPLNLVPSIFGPIVEPVIFKLYQNIPFMVVSESTKKDLIKWKIPNYHIKVIRNGRNTPNLKKLPLKERQKTAIFLGSISKDKGIEDAIKIFKLLNDKKNTWRFWVIGKSDPEYLKRIKTLAKKLKVINKIRFFGYVSDKEKFNLLSRAHILVNPSIREGWGLVVIEAAAVGTPAAAFDVPGLRDSIVRGKTGILCNERSLEKLANQIVKLLEDQKGYQKMRSDAFNWSKNFSWEKSANQSLNFFGKSK